MDVHLRSDTHQPSIHQSPIRHGRHQSRPPTISFLYTLFVLCALLSLINPAAFLVHAAANVTIDDGDGRIAYSPAGAWAKSAQTSLNYGESHMLTQNPNATAVFSFKGTAVYFLSPLWPYKVNTAVSLDNAPPVLIDLVDHTKPDTTQGPETVGSEVVWSVSGLENTQHTLRVSVGAGQPFGIVDGLIYTDPTISSSSQASQTAGPTTTGRILASSTSGTSNVASTSGSSEKRSPIPIALGTLFGILGILIIVGAIWYFCRKRRRPTSEAWTEGSYGGPGGAVHGYGHGGASYGHQPPPQAYGVNGQYDYSQHPQFGYGSNGAPPPSFYAPIHPGQPHPGNSAFPGVPPNRAPNRYEPGYTLSTITEKSTPQMADGNRTMPGTPRSGAVGVGAHSPASLQTDLGYYTAPGSSAGQYSPPQQGGAAPALVAQAYSQGQDAAQQQNYVQQTTRKSEKKRGPSKGQN